MSREAVPCRLCILYIKGLNDINRDAETVCAMTYVRCAVGRESFIFAKRECHIRSHMCRIRLRFALWRRQAAPHA